ncbi:MAG: hypothetical protein ACR2KT_00675 [Methylocella sp.]|nr:MAG: hypothetical protein DLM68_02080 [Hyphomicrobiales bacterium]
MSLPLEERVSASGAAARDGDMPVLSDPERQFQRNYNRHTFAFPHGLTDHPLFELSSLVELARRPFHHEAYWSNGKVDANDPWEINRDARLSLVDTIANIGDNNSLVILKHVEQDPVYGPVLQEILARVVAFSGEQMRQEVLVGEVLILIASPNRLTSYHMDAECNFLVQVAGSKTFFVYDHTDPTLVSDEEREQYQIGNHNSIVYQESRQCEATAYELHAGYGVHVPVFAPHWARNHDNVSVALSVNYELRPMARRKTNIPGEQLAAQIGGRPDSARHFSLARPLKARRRERPLCRPRAHSAQADISGLDASVSRFSVGE